MSETYIVTAKTIDEAIAKANKLYADGDHEISYDILEMPKKGFLGIGAKDAMLKVTVNETKDADLSALVSDLKSMKLHTDKNGGTDREVGKTEAQKTENKQQNRQKPAQSEQQNKPKQQNQQSQKKGDKSPEKTSEKSSEKTADAKPVDGKTVDGKTVDGKTVRQNKPEQKQAPVKTEKAPEQKPPRQPKADKAEDAMPKGHAQAIVSAPVGLSDLPEKTNTDVWGREKFADVVSTVEAEETDAVPTKDEVKVAVSEEEMQYALAFANTILRDMQIDAKAERGVCPEGETFETTEEATVYPRIEIVGEGTGILIGHHGETLDAIQYLVNLSAIRKSRKTGGHGDYVKIVVDVENYRTKREDTLRSLARRMAARAVKNKHNVFLEPMNAYERRIIHSELQSYPDVSTHSVGSDKNRKIIITYEGADKQPANNRRRPQKARTESQATQRPAQKFSGDRPRPKKPQKMPIEKLPDFLAASSSEPVEPFSLED